MKHKILDSLIFIDDKFESNLLNLGLCSFRLLLDNDRAFQIEYYDL